MNDQEKAREEQETIARNEAMLWYWDTIRPYVNSDADAYKLRKAVLSADPHVIAEAMGGEYETECRILEDGEDELCPVIVLPPRKVES